MEELKEYSEQEESNFDFKAELYKYLTYWHWLLLGAIIGLAIAFLYNRYTAPDFRTEATMMMLKEGSNNIAIPSGGASILSLDNSDLANQIESLTSKQLVEEVINELDLNISYFFEGNVIAVEAYKNSPIKIKFISPDSLVNISTLDFSVSPESSSTFKLSDESSGYSKTHRYGEGVVLHGLKFIILPEKGSENFNKTIRVNLNPIRAVANDYLSRMTIIPKGKAMDILSLSIVGTVPAKSQDFLNALMKHFNREGMEDKSQVAESTTEFIRQRLQLISEELDSVEGGIADFKRDNQIMDVASSAGVSLSKSQMAEQQIFDIETQLMILESVQAALTGSGSYGLLPTSLGIQDGGVSGSIGKYNDLVMKRQAYLNTATTESPIVIAVTEQIDALKENLLRNIERTKKSLNIQKRELGNLDQRAEGEFSTFPGLEKGIRSIERQQGIKEQLYLFLLQRREEAAISYAATSPVAKVIDPAYTVADPVDPRPWLLLLGGFIIGLLLPLAIIFIKNFLDTKVHHKGDLNPLIKNIPFLGEIPRIKKEEDEIIQINDRSPLAESFRILRTNLSYLVQSRNKENGEVIFVTSTIKGEGKTFVSFNTARTLASTGKKVVLVGADIRNPKLHRYSNDPLETKGLSDFLYNTDVNIEDVIRPSELSNIKVDMVFSGSIPPNPAELLMNNRMREIIMELKSRYDFVIVDTAPAMIVTDTLLISQLADTTLYVVKAGFTEKKLLDFPKDLKKQGKLKGLAIVLNDVDYSKFSYGAKYGYAYGYGYGYGADEKKSSLLRWFKKKP